MPPKTAARYTPRPWRYESPAPSISAGDRVQIARVELGGSSEMVPDRATHQANARLISVAPDAFETMEALLASATAIGNHDTKYPHRSDTDPMTSGCKFCRAQAEALRIIDFVRKGRKL